MTTLRLPELGNVALRAPRAAGFTLVEVMVAMIVFAVGLLSLATLMPSGSGSVNRSADQTRASELLSQSAENLLSASYSDSTLVAGSHSDPTNPYDGKYYVRWTVEDDQPIPECKRVTITAGWPISLSFPGARVVIVKPRSGG
ncbi:MAG: type IV pilus modification PilV family protein [Candidatus Eiseniibacteriota bacterium]